MWRVANWLFIYRLLNYIFTDAITNTQLKAKSE
nr:MAG TPA: hypothetical protein [Caudoviricetes sp.]